MIITEVTQRTSEQWAPKVNLKLDFSESGQSRDLGHPTRGEVGGPGTCLLAGSNGVSVPTVGCDIKLFPLV